MFESCSFFRCALCLDCQSPLRFFFSCTSSIPPSKRLRNRANLMNFISAYTLLSSLFTPFKFWHSYTFLKWPSLMYDIFHPVTKRLFISSCFQEKGKSCTRREGTKGLGRTEGAKKKERERRIIKPICLSPQRKKKKKKSKTSLPFFFYEFH